MSRTDVHAPYRVKARDPLWRDHFVESHHHAQHRVGCYREPGPPPRWISIYQPVTACDMGAFLAGEQNTACYMSPAPVGRNFNCGCRLCTGQPGRRYSHRQARGAWRAWRRRLLTDPARNELDVPPLRGSAW